MEGSDTRLTRLRPGRPISVRAAAWLAVFWMCVAAVGFWPGERPLWPPVLAGLAGAGFLVLALRGRSETPLFGPALHPVSTQRRIRWLPVGLGLICLTLVMLRGGSSVFWMQFFLLTPIYVQATLLFAGISLLVVGLGGLRWRDVLRLRPLLVSHRRELILVMTIMGLALAVRAYQIEAVRIQMDEGPFISAILKMRSDPTVPLTALMHPIASSTRLFPFTQMLFTDLFGSTIAVFRLAGVMYGVFTVGATYGLTRQLIDRRTAIIAALLLATFPPHIHMSRIGIYNIADPLFGVSALYFFARAVRSQRRLDYVLAGAALGMLPYFYEAGELLFPLLLLAWGLWLRFSKGPSPSRRGLAALLATAVPIALPVYYSLVSFQLPLFTRLDATHASTNHILTLLIAPDGFAQLLSLFKNSILPPFLHYVHTPDPSWFYGGQTALVLPILVPLLLLGIVFALWRLQCGGVLLILWLLLTALGNGLLDINNWTPRFVVAMPALAMLMALGLRCGLPLLLRRPHRQLVYSLALLICVVQVGYYFGLHLPYYQEQIVLLRRHYDVVFRTLALPENTDAIFLYDDKLQIPEVFAYELLEFLGDSHPFQTMPAASFVPESLDHDKHYVIFVDPQDDATLARMEAVWDMDGPHFDSPNVPVSDQYAAYRVSPSLWRKAVETPDS